MRLSGCWRLVRLLLNLHKCLCLLCLEGHVRAASGHTLQIRVRFDTLIFETRRLLLLLLLLYRGGDLGGTGGTVPQNLRWGDGPCIGPPNILRSSVVGCACKYEQSEKWWFSCEEMVIYDI